MADTGTAARDLTARLRRYGQQRIAPLVDEQGKKLARALMQAGVASMPAEQRYIEAR